MYFDGVEKFDLDQWIVDHKNIYAHIADKRQETLKEHIDLVVEYLHKIIEKKQLSPVLVNFETYLGKHMSYKGKIIYREMQLNTIYMHDLGKINCNFQYHKMQNKIFEGKKGLECNNSNHSMLSSLIYINHYFNKVQQEAPTEDRSILYVFMMLNAYVISKHHGSFDTFEVFKNKFLDLDGEGKRLYTEQLAIFEDVYREAILFSKNEHLSKRIFDNIDKTLSKKENKESVIYFYIYERFIASLLLSCDYYATSHFKHQREIKDFGEIQDINKFYEAFKNTDIYKDIRRYEKESYGKRSDFYEVKDINILRNELFLEAEENLLKNMGKSIFYLEAPTGSGKSNVSFNLSFKLLEKIPSLNKIFYIYPFNTLIEQNINTLEKTFSSSDVMKDIAVINSVVPIKTQKKVVDERSDVIKDDYEISLLDRQFLHYPMILTTHVSLFNYLFGTSKDDLFPLYQIANSIIILDEIQSYKNSIWKEIITFLKYYAEILNIKFIIMSATLPNLNKLIDQETEMINLVQNREKYFSNSIFKDRVKLDFSLMDLKENILETLLEHVIKIAEEIEGNILIEFIKKATAMDFFKELNECNDFLEGSKKKEIQLITGDDNSIDRNAIIERVKHNKNIILVATQVIEAGVDIDMDVGYKDISMLDAEEQFLGRINRSCMKSGSKVYFFDFDGASTIYKNDVRKEKHINLTSEKIRDILIHKNFSIYYGYVLELLNKRAKELTDKNFHDFISDTVKNMNFTKVQERMQLIDERYEYSVFLSRSINRGNNEFLDGEKVWNEYISLLKNNNLDFAEKKVKLSRATADLNHFIYKVTKSDFTYQERIGDIYYIDDGEKYFTEGKFDRKKFDKGIGDFI